MSALTVAALVFGVLLIVAVAFLLITSRTPDDERMNQHRRDASPHDTGAMDDAFDGEDRR